MVDRRKRNLQERRGVRPTLDPEAQSELTEELLERPELDRPITQEDVLFETRGLDTDTTKKILVCEDCAVYYEYTDAWEVCPKCGEALTTVEKAD